MLGVNADALADALKATLEDIDSSPKVSVYKWSPGLEGLDKTPCVVIYPPAIQRSDMLVSESELGSRDWLYTFDVEVKFELTRARSTQAAALAYVEQAIEAVDTSAELVALTEDEPKVISAEPDYSVSEQGSRSFFHYLLQVAVPTLRSY